ncbi:MAG: 4-(cytidine 5'-diphospho)-2-C-methyl-D-erythritol kinase [Peptoniphilaceae bacterium]|nr:4-(cytidine 5'-diphospho)-2-C-methyl-D-erythritol kinase [Peptoniphilaceae bacterium]MDY6018677.1 4-(cytidine 5'-diphospho)-2-C-methyl-D-erythritol kinase [Anaerococcus sp.]
MIRKCYAKLNLSLDSLFKREDGYHEIDSLMVRISLADKIEIKKNPYKKIRIFTESKKLLSIEDNLVYKAWNILKDNIEDNGVDIILEKNIPFAAGLAGGSTDAAETLKALNELWDLGFSQKELMDKALMLGADVPFFFMRKPARARGIGEILTSFDIKNDLYFLLVNDGTEISSAFIYSKLADYGYIDNEKIISLLEKGDKNAYSYFSNVMEDVAFETYPHLKDIKKEIKDSGALASLMSGSGATIFGVFEDEDLLKKAYDKIKDKYKFVKKVNLVND